MAPPILTRLKGAGDDRGSLATAAGAAPTGAALVLVLAVVVGFAASYLILLWVGKA